MKSTVSSVYSLSQARGYYIAVALVALFYGAICISVHINGWNAGWGHVGVNGPGWNGGFGDFRYILQKAECLRNSGRPYGEVPACRMTYPRIWISIVDGLGLLKSDTNAIGVVSGSVFLAVALRLFKDASLLEGLFAALILISPPVALAIERANSDLIMFAGITTACLIDPFKKKSFLSPLLILITAFLKLYPIFALIAFWLESSGKKQRLLLIACASVFAVYCIRNYGDLVAGIGLEPRWLYYSYGVNIFPQLIFQHTAYIHRLILHEKFMQAMIAAEFFIGGYFLSAYVYKYLSPRHRNLTKTSYKTLCFRAGYTIFISTYFILGNNWHYRLIFLILCLPQAFAWSRLPEKWERYQGCGFIALLMPTFWLSYLSSQIYLDHGTTFGFILVCSYQVINMLLCFAFICRLFIDIQMWIRMAMPGYASLKIAPQSTGK